MIAEASVDIGSIIGSAGGAGAAIASVILFLKYLKGKDDASERAEVAKMVAIENIGKACHKHQERMMEEVKTEHQEGIRAYSEIADKCAASLDENTRMLGVLEGKLECFSDSPGEENDLTRA